MLTLMCFVHPEWVSVFYFPQVWTLWPRPQQLHQPQPRLEDSLLASNLLVNGGIGDIWDIWNEYLTNCRICFCFVKRVCVPVFKLSTAMSLRWSIFFSQATPAPAATAPATHASLGSSLFAVPVSTAAPATAAIAGFCEFYFLLASSCLKYQVLEN